jgi:hypothetical protein
VTFTDTFSGRREIGVMLERCSRNPLRGLAQENRVSSFFSSFLNFGKETSALEGQLCKDVPGMHAYKQRISPGFFVF